MKRHHCFFCRKAERAYDSCIFPVAWLNMSVWFYESGKTVIMKLIHTRHYWRTHLQLRVQQIAHAFFSHINHLSFRFLAPLTLISWNLTISEDRSKSCNCFTTDCPILPHLSMIKQEEPETFLQIVWSNTAVTEWRKCARLLPISLQMFLFAMNTELQIVALELHLLHTLWAVLLSEVSKITEAEKDKYILKCWWS